MAATTCRTASVGGTADCSTPCRACRRADRPRGPARAPRRSGDRGGGRPRGAESIAAATVSGRRRNADATRRPTTWPRRSARRAAAATTPCGAFAMAIRPRTISTIITPRHCPISCPNRATAVPEATRPGIWIPTIASSASACVPTRRCRPAATMRILGRRQTRLKEKAILPQSKRIRDHRRRYRPVRPLLLPIDHRQSGTTCLQTLQNRVGYSIMSR
mmetsp:Transcript_2762/g.6149  ORF Transcript_2762/g.6149 Transcript_2762/m.6149 type:complete len:218 (+) Transcript_2762:290-943(+)